MISRYAYVIGNDNFTFYLQTTVSLRCLSFNIKPYIILKYSFYHDLILIYATCYT